MKPSPDQERYPDYACCQIWPLTTPLGKHGGFMWRPAFGNRLESFFHSPEARQTTLDNMRYNPAFNHGAETPELAQLLYGSVMWEVIREPGWDDDADNQVDA